MQLRGPRGPSRLSAVTNPAIAAITVSTANPTPAHEADASVVIG